MPQRAFVQGGEVRRGSARDSYITNISPHPSKRGFSRTEVQRRPCADSAYNQIPCSWACLFVQSLEKSTHASLHSIWGLTHSWSFLATNSPSMGNMSLIQPFAPSIWLQGWESWRKHGQGGSGMGSGSWLVNSWADPGKPSSDWRREEAIIQFLASYHPMRSSQPSEPRGWQSFEWALSTWQTLCNVFNCIQRNNDEEKYT